jgi:hypothetical protein
MIILNQKCSEQVLVRAVITSLHFTTFKNRHLFTLKATILYQLFFKKKYLYSNDNNKTKISIKNIIEVWYFTKT